jgi:hypothetical protein
MDNYEREIGKEWVKRRGILSIQERKLPTEQV